MALGTNILLARFGYFLLRSHSYTPTCICLRTPLNFTCRPQLTWNWKENVTIVFTCKRHLHFTMHLKWLGKYFPAIRYMLASIDRFCRYIHLHWSTFYDLAHILFCFHMIMIASMGLRLMTTAPVVCVCVCVCVCVKESGVTATHWYTSVFFTSTYHILSHRTS